MIKSVIKLFDSGYSFLLLVMMPFVIVALYYGLIASDRFTSESIVTIKETSSGSTDLEVDILGLSNTAGMEDERIIEEYIISSDMFRYLDETISLRKHYEDVAGDWISSLSSGATFEDAVEYYQDHIDVYLDETNGLLRIEVQAFSREYANNMLKILLERSEEVVNEFSHLLANAQYSFVEKQVAKSQDSLKMAKQDLLQFQNKYQMFSPEQQGQSLTAILDTLEGQLTQEKAKLKQILTHQKSSSPQAVSAKDTIKALEAQIADEKQRLVGEGDQEINDLMVEYTNLELDLEFAKDAYASALVALETSRAEVSKKLKHLVIVTHPTYADEAKYPDRPYIIITAFILLVLIYGIIKMIITTIKEHQD